jgi:hypothetical protein
MSSDSRVLGFLTLKDSFWAVEKLLRPTCSSCVHFSLLWVLLDPSQCWEESHE